jgi:hypothetical protein
VRQKSTKNKRAFRRDLAIVKKLWPGQIHGIQRESLKAICREHQFSVRVGDLQLLEGRWYVTHSGLVRLSRRHGCSGIQVHPVPRFCDAEAHRWVFKATVYKSSSSQGFVGHGDADPSNTSSVVRGAEMRVAETRAVNRALRKAYGIGLCSVEELGYLSSPPERVQVKGINSSHSNGNGSCTGQPRLRDRLCLLIRKYEFDPALVKRYAADFCGTETLRDASRDLVEAFISTLAEEATKDRAALICKLNSYSQLQEVKS